MTNNRENTEAAGAGEAGSVLAAIDVAQVEASTLEGADEATGSAWDADREAALIECTRKLMALSGLAYSAAATRDLPDMRGEAFTPKSAVSALNNAGYRASFGGLDPKALTAGMCPAILFDRDGRALLLQALDGEGSATLWEPSEGGAETTSPLTELAARLLPHVILAQKRDSNARTTRPGDWFWGSMRQGKWLYGQVALAALMANLLGLATPLFIMVVYDRVVPNQATESLIVLTIGVLVALAFDFTIKMLRGQFVDRAGRRADGRMARLIFDKILAMPSDRRRQNAGAMSSIVREFDTLREFFTSATLIAVVDLPFVFLFLWVISLIAGPLAAVPFVAVPLVIVCGLVIQPMLSRITESSMNTGMSKQGALIETLNGLETIQATGSGHLMRRRFEEASDTQSELGLKSRTLSQFAINAAASIQQLAQVAIIFYGVFLIQAGTITMGAMIAAVILSGRILAPLSQLAAALTRANAARQAYRSLSALMSDQSAAEVEARPRLSRPVLRGEIEFKNVTYQFPGASAPVISDLSFKIKPGQKVAVLGRMGSGKSTLVRLLAGLIEPTSGAVLIDGVDARQIDKSDLRRNVGVMLQESWLFSGTVKENLQMGFYEYGDAHILSIAQVSGVDDFIAGHPQGYDLEIRERGEGLSGGQRQSINLARALLHDPGTVIFDEPTSSMDTATEKTVIDRLRGWGADKTFVMVTHRNTLLDIADRVLVMDRGKIVADTTPSQIRASA